MPRVKHCISAGVLRCNSRRNCWMASFLPPCPISLSPEPNESPHCPYLCWWSNASKAWLRMLCFSGLMSGYTACVSDCMRKVWCSCYSPCPDGRCPLGRAQRGEVVFSAMAKKFQGARVRGILTVMEFLNKQISLAMFLLERKMWQEDVFDSVQQPA